MQESGLATLMMFFDEEGARLRNDWTRGAADVPVPNPGNIVILAHGDRTDKQGPAEDSYIVKDVQRGYRHNDHPQIGEPEWPRMVWVTLRAIDPISPPVRPNA
jgi:hypothetical protein